tara:strand:- start:307 stop:996 length:690 start_codon:yes stop_codon:yes gene_type:complete
MDILKHYKSKFLFIKQLLQRDDPVIVEIGAHYGEDSMRFMKIFKNLSLHCFEPDPRNIKIFKQFINDDRVKLYEMALSNKKGNAKFYQSYQPYEQTNVPSKYDWIEYEDYREEKLNNSGSSSLKKGYAHTLDTPIHVQTERFEDWYSSSDLNEIDFVWIDVQGAEKDVLDGMASAISKIKFIWVEYGEKEYEDSMTREETIAYITQNGFELFETVSSNTAVGDLLFQRI